MNTFFQRLSLTTKLLLLTLFPIALIIYLSLEIYSEKSKKVRLFEGYIDRVNESAEISDIVTALQVERRYSFQYALKKDLDSRARMEVQRTVTDLAIIKLKQRSDSTLKNFEDYTFVKNLAAIRKGIDTGISQELVMQYYTTTIFRLNTLNVILPVSTNRYLQPFFNDLVAQKILSEMATYLGIIRSNFYNVLYTRQNMKATLYGLAGINEIFQSYEGELLTKASPPLLADYRRMRDSGTLKVTLDYIGRVFKKFSFDTLYEADEWWRVSGDGTDEIRGLQQTLMRRVLAGMNKMYEDEVFSKGLTLILLILGLVAVFVFMFYTIHVITQSLKTLDLSAQKIAAGVIGVQVPHLSNDVVGNLGRSISKIDNNNRKLAEAADAIGKGNFNVAFEPRNESDILGNAIIRMKNNLWRFTMEIERRQEQFRQIADSAPVMIWMTDENKQCNFVNKGWLKFTGRAKEQEMGYGWIEGMHPDDYGRAAQVFDEAFAERKEYSLDYRFRRDDGEYRWLTETAKPVYSSDGRFEGYIGTCVDIHEMKTLERRRDDFIKMASHELKTPVTSIKGYVQLLLAMFRGYNQNKEEISTEAIQASLTTIDRQVIKLNRLMSELLDLSKIDSGRLELDMQNFYIDNLVTETVEDIQQITKHRISIANRTGCMIHGDKDRLGQALLNILTNAIKYSTDNNPIEVDTFQPSADAVAVSVTDHGIGIDKNDQEKIFERFYRVEGRSELTYPGFGIGLFIASEIMNRHHGKISVKSAKNKGSTFTFTLPIAKVSSLR